MNKFIKLSVLAVCLLLGNYSFAQVTAFTGKIVDEHNEPVAGTHVRIYMGRRSMELVADQNGFFQAARIPAGDYYADVNANGRIVRARKIFIQPQGRIPFYYNFKLNAHGVVVSIMRMGGGPTASSS